MSSEDFEKYGISNALELSPEIVEKERMARQRSLKRKE